MRVLVGLSGGFDSTYAAKKLMAEGHEVEGAVLVMHEYTELSSARDAARSLGIPLHEIDCRERFSVVRENFISEYSRCRTPNPCIICNAEVKLAALMEYAEERGFDRIATGHYARVVRYLDGECENMTVAVPRDRKKDQSYMLYRVPSRILSRLLLPLAEEEKAVLRADPSLADMHAYDKSDSLEICFIPSGDHASYIEERVGNFPEGDFISPDGKVLGRHKGIIRYTVGQRKGLGIAAASRLYVSEIDGKLNTVTLVDTPPRRDSLELSGICYSGILPPEGRDRRIYGTVRVRYQSRPIAAEILLRPDGTAHVTLNEPAFPVTPGQSAVVYDGDAVLLGGFID